MSYTPADDRTLQIDLDTRAALRLFLRQHRLLTAGGWLPSRPPKITRSRGGNLHAVIRLAQPTPALERVLLQALLGSDPVREARNYGRVKNGAPYPILFFEKKKQWKKPKLRRLSTAKFIPGGRP